MEGLSALLACSTRLAEAAYAESEIRIFLNSSFYGDFSESEKSRILKTKVSAERNPWFGTSGGGKTEDYLFLLSVQEVSMYFGGSGRLAKNPRDLFFIDDAYNKNRQAFDNEEKPVWWWLRTPGIGRDFACIVHQDGRICLSGYCVDEASYGGGGIRPAMWVTA